MAEERMALPHKLTLDQRKKLSMTGVTEVVSFEENSVILKTAMGVLVIQGSQLRLKTLSLEGGQVDVSGTISALIYEEPRSAGGVLRRLFG